MKPSSPPPAFLSSWSPAAPSPPAACANAWRNTGSSNLRAGRSKEAGYLLVLLLLCLSLALTFLLGTVKVVQLSQRRIAMQSRLDVCALQLIDVRRQLAVGLVRTNQVIRLTALAVSMSRGLKILTGPAGALVGTMGEAALVQTNRAAASAQEGLRLLGATREVAGALCAPSPFSKEAAFCTLSPPLPSALVRQKAPFPDLAGPLVFRDRWLARVTCRGGRGVTKMKLAGDPGLRSKDFPDFYEP